MIVERDIGRLAKFTFDMGGAGELLSLALSVPPWEDLHELSRSELRLTHLATTDAVVDVLPRTEMPVPVAEAAPKEAASKEAASKALQERFASKPEGESVPLAAKSTKTAEAIVPTNATAAPAK
jgi:hypothetical protein